jgi:MFS family permease
VSVFVKFGDGVEIYLPGVITQKVSCDLKLSHTQEGILSGILYVFLAVSNVASVLLAKKVGEKITLLCSLYMAVISTIVCSIVPNYYSLLISRALIGLGCGLNSATIGVFCAKNVSSKDILNKLSFYHSGLGFTLGGSWASVLGWLLLDTLNWRIFILITSIPMFIPPIIILHLWSRCELDNENLLTESTSLVKAESEAVPVDKFATRTFKASLFLAFCLYMSYGIIMILPSLIKKSNLKKEHKDVNECEQFIVHGNQYLILVGVIGLANIIGRPVGYFLRNHLKFKLLQSALMVSDAISFSIILTRPGLMIESIMMGMAKFCYSIQMTEAKILQFDVTYFGLPGLAVGSALMEVSAKISVVITTFVAAFIDPYHAMIIMLVVSLAQIVVICSMTERH